MKTSTSHAARALLLSTTTCEGTLTIVELPVCEPSANAVTLNTPESPSGDAVTLLDMLPEPDLPGMVREAAQQLSGLEVGAPVPAKYVDKEIEDGLTATGICFVSLVDMLTWLGDWLTPGRVMASL